MRFLVCDSWRRALGAVLVACGPLVASADEAAPAVRDEGSEQ